MKTQSLLLRLLGIILVVGALLWAPAGYCHNIQITPPVRGPLTGGSTTVTFTVSWDASWRITAAPSNWDAAWVFMKFRKNGGDWTHASLNQTGHVVPAGTTGQLGLADTSLPFNIATNPAVGIFLYRSANGSSSTFTVSDVELSWNYAQDGVVGSDDVEVQIFGVEMVYIPQGAFLAGDNATSTAAFRQGSSDTDPWYISSEGSISTGAQAGSGTGLNESASEYYYVSAGNSGEDASGAPFLIPAEYPKGFQPFYMMKGEISQGQWVAFFNTLPAGQRAARDITSASGKNSDGLVFRNNVSWLGSGDATHPNSGDGATFAGGAMNYLGWADVAAYLDWAGLRPMSELELERAGRGPYRAFAGEYAWGNASIVGATTINDAGKLVESAQISANCVFNSASGVQGPMRVGAMSFAKATRVETGSGYFGTMDLSGNVTEMCVTVGNSTGRGFNGARHGNGKLTSAGEADVASWPQADGVGAGFSGGDWSSSADAARLSNRQNRSADATARASGRGGRGVRTAS